MVSGICWGSWNRSLWVKADYHVGKLLKLLIYWKLGYIDSSSVYPGCHRTHVYKHAHRYTQHRSGSPLHPHTHALPDVLNSLWCGLCNCQLVSLSVFPRNMKIVLLLVSETEMKRQRQSQHPNNSRGKRMAIMIKKCLQALMPVYVGLLSCGPRWRLPVCYFSCLWHALCEVGSMISLIL